MSRKAVPLPPTELLDHPAVLAWARLGPERIEPRGIVRLQKKTKGQVYRLDGVGPGGSHVVAKRSSPERIGIERLVYERVLPRLPIRSVRYYGTVEEPEAGCCWLFLEDADGEDYSSRVAEHRAAAGRWLGRLHTSAACAVPADGLPDRGPGYYLGRLRSAREAILRARTNPALAAEDRAVLEAVVGQCEIAAAHWGRVEALCATLPKSLIHGDFAPKNLRVRTGPTGAALRPFDWGSAGWGVAAADLVQCGPSSGLWSYWASPDLAAYGASVRDCWPDLAARDLRPVAAVGKIFRCAICIDLDAPDPVVAWAEGSARNMRGYRAEMDDAIQSLGWGRCIR